MKQYWENTFKNNKTRRKYIERIMLEMCKDINMNAIKQRKVYKYKNYGSISHTNLRYHYCDIRYYLRESKVFSMLQSL